MDFATVSADENRTTVVRFSRLSLEHQRAAAATNSRCPIRTGSFGACRKPDAAANPRALRSLAERALDRARRGSANVRRLNVDGGIWSEALLGGRVGHWSKNVRRRSSIRRTFRPVSLLIVQIAALRL